MSVSESQSVSAFEITTGRWIPELGPTAPLYPLTPLPLCPYDRLALEKRLCSYATLCTLSTEF
jgi:hypothetical protein